MQKYGLYRQNMMWLTSTVTHFLTGVSMRTSPNFSKGLCARELLTTIDRSEQCLLNLLKKHFETVSGKETY